MSVLACGLVAKNSALGFQPRAIFSDSTASPYGQIRCYTQSHALTITYRDYIILILAKGQSFAMRTFDSRSFFAQGKNATLRKQKASWTGKLSTWYMETLKVDEYVAGHLVAAVSSPPFSRGYTSSPAVSLRVHFGASYFVMGTLRHLPLCRGYTSSPAILSLGHFVTGA